MAFGQYTGLIGTVVGGVIGAVLSPYTGGSSIAVGMALGGALGGIAGQMFWPERADLNLPPPPQPNERAQQISTYGATIPKVWGSKRLAGNIIAMSDIVPQTIRTRHRANGVRYYEMTRLYTCTFAIAFCEGPITGISRLWVNGQIFADFRDPSGAYYPSGSGSTALANLNTSLARAEQYFTIYTGGEDQLPDPALEAVFGAGQVPAYRGTCYVVFRDFPVGEFQGIPTIEAEIVAAGSATYEDHAADFSAYNFSPTVACDTDGNLVKWDTTTRRVYIFAGFSNTLLRSFACPQIPAGYSMNGIGCDPNTGLLILGGNNGLTTWDSAVVHYIYDTDGTFIASWSTTGSVYGGVPTYAWTTEGLVVHYESAGVPPGWSYGSQMALYRDIYGELLEILWGPGEIGDSTPDWAWARYAEFLGLRPDPDAYVRMPAGGGHYRFAWSQLVRVDYSGRLYGNLPAGSFVATDLSDSSGGTYKCITETGDLVCYSAANEIAYLHAGLSSTRRQRTKYLETDAALSQVVTDICAAAGIGAGLIDVTALASDEVLGYYVPRQMPARTALELLMTAFSFDAAEVDWKLVFKKRGGGPVAVIPATDLAAKEGAAPNMDELVETRATDLELPTHLLLTYESKARDYQLATQSAVRVDRPMYRMATQQFGLVMTDEHAKRTAEILLKQIWTRRAYGFTTTHKWLKLAPCDVATVAGKDMRIVGMTDRQGVVEFAAEAEPGGTYVSSAQAQDLSAALVPVGGGGFVPNLLLLEIPPIEASAERDLAAIYVALYGVPSVYRGGVVRLSVDQGVSWTEVAGLDSSSAKVGSVEGALGAGAPGALDYTRTLAVDFADSETVPASATDGELAAGANLVAVGAGSAWELIQFKTATNVAGHRWSLTGLLRGLYGTDAMTAVHVAAERAVILSGLSGLQRVTTTNLGRAHLFLAATSAGATGASQSLTPVGVSLKPFPPADVRGSRNSSLDLAIAWRRADRREFAFPDLMDYAEEAPLSETSESYEVDIVNPIGGGIVRTLASGTPAGTYTAAQQNADGYPALKMFTDCSVDFGPYLTNRSQGATCRVGPSYGQLQMMTTYNWSTDGPAAEVTYIIPRSGKVLIGFKWYRSLYLEANPFGDGACGLYLVKQAPAYSTAQWNYHRPEYNVGTQSCLHLCFTNAGGRGSASGLGQARLAQRLSGTNSTLATSVGSFDYKAGADPKSYIWEIDFANHTARVLADGVEIIPSTAWSTSLDAQLGSNCQIVFQCNYYWDYLWHYFDDIGIYGSGAGAYPVTVDIYQKGALGRGYPRRAYL